MAVASTVFTISFCLAEGSGAGAPTHFTEQSMPDEEAGEARRSSRVEEQGSVEVCEG
jgi:hypothetical protein